ncbi:MAG: histidine kinase [Rubrivivax sp.]
MPSMSTLAQPAEAPGGALPAALRRMRRRGVRTPVFVAGLCLAVAALLAAIDGGGLGTKLVYAFAIGIACTVYTSLARLAAAGASDLWRRLRGLPAAEAGFGAGWTGVLPAVLAAMLAGPPTGLAIADRLTGNASPSLLEMRWASTRLTIALAVIGTVASVVVLSLQERLAAARLAAEAAERQAAQSRLRLLQSQLEPHMLFNTLANLRVLIGLDAAAAQSMLDRLIAFLRATLGASQAAQHALAREFAWLDDYLALMRVRMGERLTVELELPPELAALPVPPLLLQPLVENAVRHGLEPQLAAGRVSVRAARAGDALVLTVHDTGVGLAPGAAAPGGRGFGLAQVRERLRAIYGPDASLALEPAAAGGTLATLRLPLARGAREMA